MKIKIVPAKELFDADSLSPQDFLGDEESLDELEKSATNVEPGSKVRVTAHLPHVQKWGHQPTHEMTYLWPGGPLEIGDLVVCPPTPLGNGKNFVGMVTAFGDGGYKGPCKMLLGRADEIEMDQD